MEWRDEMLFDRVAGEEHQDRLAAAKARNEVLDQQEAERAAKAKVEADERSRIGHARSLLREYEAAGVAPPFTTDEGVPTVSLSMLLMIGWSVDVFGGVATLHRPRA